MKHVKHNPHIVFEEKVDFRSASGKFAKPYRAAYALITFPRKRKPVIIDLQWLGRKSNADTIAYVQDFLVQYYRELTAQEIIKEEAAREKLKFLPIGKIPKKLEYTVKKTKTLPRTKLSGEVRKVIGFNYMFKKAVRLDWGSAPAILEAIGKIIIRETIKLSRHYSLREHETYIKYFGGTYYMRGGKPDLNGFSRPRATLNEKQYIKTHVDDINSFYVAKIRGVGGREGYLNRLLGKVLDSKGQPILDKNGKQVFKQIIGSYMLVTGFRIEFSKIMT